MIILHATLKNYWENAQISHKFGVEAIKETGYLHCQSVSSVTAQNFTFPSIRDYIILCIDTTKVTATIKETPEGIDIYGIIDTSAIIAAINYTSDANDQFIMSPELNDIVILNEVLENMKLSYESHQYLKDGSSSRTILFNNAYTIKQNIPALLKSEVLFSATNQNPKLQRIQFIEPAYRFVVYNFIPGEVMHFVEDFDDLLASVQEITSSYAPYTGDEFGYLFTPVSSWTDFLKGEVQESSMALPESFQFLPQVYRAIETVSGYPFAKKLLHGDFGTHNFIKQNGKFEGAIDPIPLAGDPLYDLLFALVSNAALLPHISVDYLAHITQEPEEKVKAMLTIVLFCRLGRCLKHHKEDFDAYMEYWDQTIA